MFLLTIFTLAFAHGRGHRGSRGPPEACRDLTDDAMGELLTAVAQGFYENAVTGTSFCYLMPKSEEWPHMEVPDASEAPDSAEEDVEEEPSTDVVPAFRRILRGGRGGRGGRRGHGDRGCGNEGKFSVTQAQFSGVSFLTKEEETESFECLTGDELSFTVGDIVLNLPADDDDENTVLGRGRLLRGGRGGRGRGGRSDVSLTVPITQSSANGDIIMSFTCRAGRRTTLEGDDDTCVAEDILCNAEYSLGESETAEVRMVCKNADWAKGSAWEDEDTCNVPL